MGTVPLFTTPPWVIGVFYAVLGFLFGVLAERTTYCIAIAIHQVMGARYSRIYEMILTGIATPWTPTFTCPALVGIRCLGLHLWLWDYAWAGLHGRYAVEEWSGLRG